MPNVLRRAADVRYLGHSADGDQATLLRFEAAPFGSVAGELFSQQLLWDDGPTPEQTAFELLAGSLVDIAEQRRESNRFDLGLLTRVGSYGKLVRAKHGLTAISLPDAATPAHAGARGRIDARVVDSADALAASTPEPRRVRVAGRLDLLGVSQQVLKIVLDPQTVVTAVWSAEQAFTGLKDFLDRDVLVEGLAVFRPTGSLLRIDADVIAAATARDDFFRTLPQAPPTRDYARLARLRPGEKSAYAKILGSIPAEESDEEFARALEELS
ncbi:MAG: hypothetical protein L6Q99_03005 [Planctomycetes bacterium]|nr:hypothetical protein [Planctomycetota bacterium]